MLRCPWNDDPREGRRILDDPKGGDLRRRGKEAAAALRGETLSPLWRDPGIMGGEPVFAGTRAPVSHMLDYLQGGYGLDEFLDDLPEVRREQGEQAIDLLRDALSGLAPVRPRPDGSRAAAR